jgi:hypothetical protein
MSRFSARSLLFFGFILVLLGFVLPLLIVLKILESTFPLNFFSFTVSLAGLFLGLIGAAQYAAESRRKRDE